MRIILLLAFTFLIYSCTPTQVIEITSKSAPENAGAFVFENDTLKVSYNFWARSGQMCFTVYNKLNVPVYLDWKNSGFILNGENKPYFIEGEKSKTKGHTDIYYYYGFSSYQGNTTTVKNERVTSLMPHSGTNRVYYHLYNTENILPTYGTSRTTFDIKGHQFKGRDKKYSESESPEHFRNFISYSLNEDMKGLNHIDNEFYFSRLMIIRADFLRYVSSYTKFFIGNSIVTVGKDYL